MTEAETIKLLLQWLIGVVGFIGAGVITLQWNLLKSVSNIEKDHGSRIAVLEARASMTN